MSIRNLSREEFGAVFQRFADSPTSTAVFRWESLQEYAVAAEDASLHAFRTGAPMPERSVRTQPWLARIATSTVVGKDWSRVRYVVEPHTEYTAWEFVSYVESQAAGERILITTDATVTLPDFWLFDGAQTADRHAVLMHYDAGGAPISYEYRDDEAQLAILRRAAEELTAAAVPLNTYLARHRAARPVSEA